jgi:fibro-slime domain-containing protein
MKNENHAMSSKTFSVLTTLALVFSAVGAFPLVAGACVPPPCNNNTSQTIVSDTATSPSVLVSLPLNVRWTASIDSGAAWIWGENPVADPVAGATETFTRTFNITGAPLGATLDIAADNGYSVSVNGISTYADPEEFNYQLPGTVENDVTHDGQDSYTIPASDLKTGENTITFTVTNMPQVNGTNDTNPGGLLYKLVVNQNECQTPPPTTATVVATKVVCNSEADLPNWGNGGADITADTAANYVAQHPNCHLQSGWNFQWAPNGTTNPGDNNTDAAGSPWLTFGPTNSSGVASVQITPADGNTWFREILKPDFINFSGWVKNDNNPTEQDAISAEMYCNNDVLNYDNYDWINPVVAGQTYYCVAFNAPKVPSCSLTDGKDGWYGVYYNYPSTNIGMELPNAQWGTTYGNPLGANGASWTANWYDSQFARFSQVDSNLMFGPSWFPFDGSKAEEITNGHDYHFGAHWAAKVTAPSTNDYAYTLSSDDDVWVYVDGALVVDNSGVHPSSPVPGNIHLTAGTHTVDVYFAERHTVESEMSFAFTDSSLVIKPYSSDCTPVVPPTCPQGQTGTYPNCVPVNPPIVCQTGFHLVENQCVANPPTDPVCTENQHLDDHVCVENHSENPPSNPSIGGGGGGGGGGSFGGRRHDVNGLFGGGQVLGASTGPMCEEYIKSYIKLGGKNDPEDVKRLQTFLNEFMGAGLTISGTYDQATFDWVKKFQSMHDQSVLAPWANAGLPTGGPTGYVYKTTKRWINLLKCPELWPTLGSIPSLR